MREKESEERAVPAKSGGGEQAYALPPGQGIAGQHRPVVGYKVAVEVGQKHQRWEQCNKEIACGGTEEGKHLTSTARGFDLLLAYGQRHGHALRGSPPG